MSIADLTWHHRICLDGSLRFIQNFCQKEKICGTWKKSSFISGRREEEKEDEDEEEEEEEDGVNPRYFKKWETEKVESVVYSGESDIGKAEKKISPEFDLAVRPFRMSLCREPFSVLVLYASPSSLVVGIPSIIVRKKQYQIFGMDF